METKSVKVTGPFCIDEWNTLVDWLQETFEPEDLQNLIFHYKEGQVEDMKTSDGGDTKSWQQYFYDVIDCDEDKMRAAVRLKSAAEQVQLHNIYGESVADIIQHFINRLATYMKDMKAEEHQLFIGRKKEVDLVSQLLTDTFIVGVSLCGIGGQGKSSVARRVCRKLTTRFNIVMADLRDKPRVVDVIRSVLAGADVKFPTTTRQGILETILLNYIDNVNSDTLILLDDCDKVLKKERSEFEKFLNKILIKADNSKEKVRFLLTMREKLGANKDMGAEYTLRLSRQLAEVELQELEQSEAEELLRTCSEMDIEERVAAAIVNECAYSPLAVSVVAGLIKSGTFAPDRLLLYIKLDKRNVSRALRIDYCIGKAIHDLKPELQKVLGCLSVFQSSCFGIKEAAKVTGKTYGRKDNTDDNTNMHNYMKELRRIHLVELEEDKVRQGDKHAEGNTYNRNNNNVKHKDLYSLHPLVFRYISEWNKPRDLSETYLKACQRFVSIYESKISHIVNLLESKYWKGHHKVEIHNVHILRFYEILTDQPELLNKHLKRTDDDDLLVKKRVSDLADILIPVVQLRRMFQSEADRALKQKNHAVYIFWMVEKADVFLMLHDKVEIAVEILDELIKLYPALNAHKREASFPSLVHGMFHKVKGLCRWKERLYKDALQHLELAVTFYQQLDNTQGNIYIGRIQYYTGRVYLDHMDLVNAEKCFEEGHNLVLGTIQARTRDIQDDLKCELHFDTPPYYFQFAKIKLIKAKATCNQQEREELLENSLHDLEKGILLDEHLKLNYLDSYYSKLKLRADVKVEKGHLMVALEEAHFVFERRREILQTPHTHYTESLYQIGRIYLLMGIELEKKKEKGANSNWDAAGVYFKRLKDCHLKNGGIAIDNPVFQDIKMDHIQLTKLTGNSDQVKEIQSFYEKVEAGYFDSEKASSSAKLKQMMWTPFEMVKRWFGDGGKEFGEKDKQLTKLENFAREQFEKMKLDESSAGAGACGFSHNSGDIDVKKSMPTCSGSISDHKAKFDFGCIKDQLVHESLTGNVKVTNRSMKRQKTLGE